jgi:N-acetylmuramoyl-L-alanine amidase
MSLASGLAVALLCSANPELRVTLEHILDRPEQVPEMKLRELRLSESTAAIGLELPRHIRLDDLPPEVENAYETAVGAIAAIQPEIKRIELAVAYPGEKLRPPPKRAPTGAPKRQYFVVPDPLRFPDGQTLFGRTVAISPGHGYIYYDSLGGYSTQRGRVFWGGCGDCRGIVEDFETHEIVIRHLIPLLEGAGARVVLVRERDYNALGSITDDQSMDYAELSGMFTTGSSEGGHAGGYRASLDAAASAEFTVAAPVSGPQWLSSWFVPGANRSSSLALQLNGRFGAIDLVYDQKTHGRRWVPLALLDLDAGETVRVKLTSPNAGEALIADAVRLGAGTHSSNHKLWEMGAQPYAAYQEAPAAVQTYGDVTIRPRYAEFYGADIYVALHSNASGQPNSTAAGLSSYRYNCGTYPDHSADPPAASCDDPPGSDRLQELIHTKMVERLRAEWDTNWVDRGPKVANFGELRELDGIPGVLIESAFHDQEALASGSQLRMTDNQSLHDPRWRRNAGYAIYQGISEYFAPGAPQVLLPPRAVAAKSSGENKITVNFETIPGATRYRIYLAKNGSRTFDGGRLVDTSPADLDNLTPGETVLVKVAALNAAGEGPASNVVAARPSNKRSQLLFVDAFEREDAWIQDTDNLHDTIATHALAAGDRPLAFDGATESAWAAGLAVLSGHDGVVLAFGAESTEHGILTETLRNEVLAFSRAGGAVFASGSEIGWALSARGDDTTRAFLTELFDASYASDDAGVLRVGSAPGGWFSATLMSDAELDDGNQGKLRARSSDVLAAGMNSVPELLYEGGAVAAVRKDKNLWLGFALDSLTERAAQAAILGAFLDNAIPVIPVEPLPDAGVPDDATVMPDADVLEDSSFPDAHSADATIEPSDAGIVPPRNVFTPKATTAVSGGCGCEATDLEDSSPAALLFLGVALILRRKRPS